MTYTIEEIIGAWYECYGEYMEELVAQAGNFLEFSQMSTFERIKLS